MRRALITGATGFIGGRLAEVACEHQIPIVALVRTWSQAARLARLPVRMVQGDILDRESLGRAMKDCDVVFHCAVDWRWGAKANRQSSANGTRNVLQVALETGIARVVFLSSIAVFGRTPPRDIMTEEEPCPHTGDTYGDGKIDAEQIALRYHQRYGLQVTILRPTIVYGPYGRHFTVGIASAIREGRMVLVNGGTGICNCLYVDNLIEAMLLAAQHPRGPGEVFHISDPKPVTWKEFIEGHARAMGDGFLPLPEMTAEEIELLRAKSTRARQSSLRQVFRLALDPRIHSALRSIPTVTQFEMMSKTFAKNVLPVRVQRSLLKRVSGWRHGEFDEGQDGTSPSPRPLLPRSAVQLYASKVVFSIDKARRMLDYRPTISFREGMDRTAEWIKWARL